MLQCRHEIYYCKSYKTCAVCILEKAKFHRIDNFLTFEKYAEHLQYLIKLDNFVPFGRPPSDKGIIQVMTKFFVTNHNRDRITKPD